MAKNIEPSLKLISKYLEIGKSERFVIPEYQRAYSWDKTQCDELFKSIEDFAQERSNDEKDPYFFGTIIVDCSDTNKLSLIDGQQRTTTFLLLLKALLLQIEQKLSEMQKDEENEGLINGLKEKKNKIIDILYKTDEDTRIELLKDWNKASEVVLLENASINETYKEELPNILSARTYDDAEWKCYKIPRKQKENKYTTFFRNFKFFYDKLSEYGESELNGFARTLLKECQVIEIRSWQLDQAITMFNSLNSTGLPLSDADIISAQMYSYAGSTNETFKATWEEIKNLTDDLNSKRIISVDSLLQEYMYITRSKNKEYKLNEVTTPGVRNYYIKMNSDIKDPNTLSRNFLKIAEIWDKIQFYPVVKLLLKFNENIKLYLISYLNRYAVEEISEAITARIAEHLIRLFTILELVDAGYSSSNFKTFLFNENLKLVDNSYSDEQIKTDFDKHIAEKWQKEDLRDRLSDYNKNVLVFLNEYLYAKAQKLPFDFDENVNIEHIMPSSGRNLNTIREDAGITTKEEFENIVNSLGNKILLEEEINKSIGRDWFKTKKQTTIKEKAGYNDSKYNIAKALVTYPSDIWTIDDINKAQEKVIERILNFIFDE